MNSWNPDKCAKAWRIAALAHEEQTYGGPAEGQYIPYINHIGSVMMEVLWILQNTQRYYNAPLALNCAILHDTIEDTQLSYEDITKEFGKEIGNGVLALSKNPEIIDKTEKMNDSLRRIKQQPHEIWLVKMADRIANLYHPPFYWDQDKILAYQQEAKIIYKHLSAADEVIAKRLLDKIEAYSDFIHP